MYTAWVCCDFREKERREVVDFFESIFEIARLDYEILDEAQLETLEEKQRKALQKHPIFIAIFTKRHKIAGKKGEKKYAPSLQVVRELGMVTALGREEKAIGAFVEEGIDQTDYIEGAIGGDYIRFNRAELPRTLVPAFNYVRKLQERCASVLQKLPEGVSSPTTNYSYNTVQKHVHIYSNGHGIIEYNYRIEVCSTNFKYVVHSFNLDDGTPANTVLQPLSRLIQAGKGRRFSEQTFSYKLLSPSNVSMELSDIEVDDQRNKRFRFSFQGSFVIGQEVNYVWAWSCPNLFPLQRAALAEGVLPLTGVYLINPAKELILNVNLEDGYPIAGSPFITAEDLFGNKLDPAWQETHKTTSFGISYEFAFKNLQNPALYSVKWRLQR